MKKEHKYRDLDKDRKEELFSNYLIDSWSFSKVATFARHEKNFECSYIYRKAFRRSASDVAGSAYHLALQQYFNKLKEGEQTDLASLQIIAFNYIDEIEANQWKTQKTTPTIAECKDKATKTVNSILKNFLSDISIYSNEIKEILHVEYYFDEFLTINGVDIPLPCHGVVDLVIKTTDDKIVVIDHKSKASFTDEKELKFSIGKQAITYVNGFEAATDHAVDEVWFVENKTSENRDKSPQLGCFKISIDKDTRTLYEAMLYEPLKRMLEAVSNPDYVYLINESDNFVDKAEIYEFWAQTMIAEIDDFNIPLSKRELIAKRLKKIRDSSLAAISPKALKTFRQSASEFIQYDLTNKNMTNDKKIEHILRSLGIIVSVAHVFNGYSSDTFLIEVSAGTNISSVFRYKLDIASALNVSSIRIMNSLFVYQGKSYVAIESSKAREKDLLFDAKHLEGFKIPIGIDNFEQLVHWDLNNPSTPHMLICGSTGSGKSVCIISIVEYAKLAGIDNILIFDPKYEFVKYSNNNISVYNDFEEIETMMEIMVEEMNENIKKEIYKKTLIVFDEFADAVSASRNGNELNVYETVVVGMYKNGLPKTERKKVSTKKSLEENLKILLQKGRSSGYRIIAATQRASVKVITGDTKVNFPVNSF